MMAPKKVDKGEAWRFIGHNCPQLEITGPYSNQYRVFIQDEDLDLVAFKPRDVKRLIDRLQMALDAIETDKATRNLNRKGRRKIATW
jgi:hypothetical protein